MQAALLSLNVFDWFLVILAAISTIRAFFRGIIKVLFSIGGLLLGIVVASWNYPAVARQLQPWILSLPARQVIAFLLILSVVMVLFTLVAGLLRKTVSAVGLGLVDRLLGGAFGLLRGVLFGVAIMLSILAFLPDSSWIRNSRLAPYFLAGAHAVSFVVPRTFAQQVSNGATHLLQQSPELFRPHTLTQPMHD